MWSLPGFIEPGLNVGFSDFFSLCHCMSRNETLSVSQVHIRTKEMSGEGGKSRHFWACRLFCGWQSMTSLVLFPLCAFSFWLYYLHVSFLPLNVCSSHFTFWKMSSMVVMVCGMQVNLRMRDTWIQVQLLDFSGVLMSPGQIHTCVEGS